MLTVRLAIIMLSIAVLGMTSLVVNGQDYPNKPLRVVTTAAGGGGDFTSRLVAQGISGPLGQPVIVDNRTSLLATDFVSKQPPDGYTLLVVGSSVWVSPLLAQTTYDVARDFSPITLVERTVMVVTVHPSLPVKSVKELIDLAKARSGGLNYGAATVGSTNHLAVELFKSLAGVNVVHVPYKGPAQIIASLLSNEVQMAIVDSGLVLPHAKSGKLKVLAVSSAGPSALVPGLPSVAASGLPGYEMTAMTGMWAPTKTPPGIINRLNQEVVRYVNLPDVKERFLTAGIEALGSSPEQFAAIIKSDIVRMEKLIKEAAIKVN